MLNITYTGQIDQVIYPITGPYFYDHNISFMPIGGTKVKIELRYGSNTPRKIGIIDYLSDDFKRIAENPRLFHEKMLSDDEAYPEFKVTSTQW